jgi:hypothetical protein
VPACNTAVKPVAPVDDIGVPAVYFAPLPPSYGTVMVPTYSMPARGALDTVAVEQFKEEIAGVGSTTGSSVLQVMKRRRKVKAKRDILIFKDAN